MGDTVEQPPGPNGTGAVIGARGARAIGRLVREAEQILGAPADIEFVIDAEAAPTLLQLRPITSLADLPELPGSWVLERDHMAGPFSRLGATLMLEPQNRVFPEALADLGVPLRAIELRWVNGHVYQRTMAVGEPEPKPGTTKPSAPPPAPVLWLLARLHPELRRRARRARRTLARDDRAVLADAEARLSDLERAWDGFAKALPAPGEQDDQALGATIQRTLGHLEESAEEHFRASIGGGAPMLGRWARTLAGHGFAPHEIATLLRGANGTRSLSDALTDAARAIARNESARRVLAAGTASSKTTDDASLVVEALTELIGRPLGDLRADHGPGGASYDLADPTLDEQPGVLLAGLSAALRNLDDAESPSGSDTGSTAPEVVAELRSRLERCDANGSLIDDLAVAQRWHALRENGNQLSFAQSGTLRRQLLELAERWVRRGRLHDARHLWNLDGSELRAQLAAWVDGRPTVVPADVPARRATQGRRQARIAPPPFLGPPPGSPPDPSVFPPAMAELTRSIMWFANHAFGAGDPRAPSAPGSSDDGAHSRPVVQGRPGSAGTARGPVRILSSPEQVAEVRDGDVLVCPYTNPNWTPALLCAAAVVTATGGALSHAAIVCRELGVPAVVGAPDAMAVLGPGQLVDVDGSTGTVTLVPAADRNDLGQAQFTAPPPPP
ncbi:MAG: PEP-utilizing enzyme [Microthrixaceae bacterium]